MYKFAKKVANHEGFTLVELIVVIAILGILAGIAIPVYSGYIKKANQAADNVLLSAVNTAIGAARAENGFAKLGSDAKLVVTSKKITGLNPGTVTLADSTDTLSTAIAASFVTYFGENTNTELKYCTSDADFEFHADTQTFSIVGGGDGSSGSKLSFVGSTYDDATGITTYTFQDADGNPITYQVSDSAMAAYNASTFGQHMTPTQLTGEVSDMVGALSSALSTGNTLATVLSNGGIDLAAMGIDASDENYQEELANAVVMYVAQSTTPESFNALNNVMASGNLGDLFTGNQGQMLSNAAMLYGVAVAYSNSDAASTQTIDGKSAQQYMSYINSQISAAAATDKPMGDKLGDILNAIGLIGNFVYNPDYNPEAEAGTPESNKFTSAFTSYITPGAGGQSQMAIDSAGYLGAMQTIAGNTGSLVSSGAIANGYSDPTIAYILSQILGG